MGKTWTVEPKKTEKKVMVSSMLIEVADEICNKYCKYPEICERETGDPDAAEELLIEKYCGECPIGKL